MHHLQFTDKILIILVFVVKWRHAVGSMPVDSSGISWTMYVYTCSFDVHVCVYVIRSHSIINVLLKSY